MFNSKNIKDILNNEYNTVFCAGISGLKWYANKNGSDDLKNINSLINILQFVKCDKIILISTIDVYEEEGDEDTELKSCIEAYGNNRLYAEKKIKDIFGDRCYIIRLGGLFGYGMRKNIIYDYICNQTIDINRNDKFQWYFMEWLKYDIEYMLKKDIHLINLFTEPVYNYEIFDYTKENTIGKKYNVKTKYTKTGYWKNKNTVLSSVSRFLKNMINGDIVISNLSVDRLDYSLLRQYGIRKIEVSPHKHFGNNFIDRELEYFDKYKNDNIYSFQSLYYPKNYKIDTDYKDVLLYTKKLIDMADHIELKY